MELLQIQIRNQGLMAELKQQEILVEKHLEERRIQEEILWRKKSQI